MRVIRKILLVGDVGGFSGFHVGDEAMLESNLALLQRLLPGASVTATSLDPATTQRLYGIAAVPRLRFGSISQNRQEALECIQNWLERASGSNQELPEALQALLAADLLVISGGGNLCSSWPEHILERLALVRMARQAGMPLIVFGQTIGPVLHREDQALVAEILKSARWLGLREANSVALALRLGAPLERIDFQLDDAITLSGAPCAMDGVPVTAQRGPLVALTLHPLLAGPAAHAWLEHLAAELDLLIEQTNAHILFIPHVAAWHDGIDDGDHAVGRALASRLANPQALTLFPVQSSAQTLWLTQQADIVVSSRYHPLVFGLAAFKPCLGLSSDRYTLVKLHGALSHANRHADLLALTGNRWEGLGRRIIELTLRDFSQAQQESWLTLLRTRCTAREKRLKTLLDCLPGQQCAAVGEADKTWLIKALARVVNAPELFSEAAEREFQQEMLLKHWQRTALEAERYALDLSRELREKTEEQIASLAAKLQD